LLLSGNGIVNGFLSLTIQLLRRSGGPEARNQIMLTERR